MYVALWYIHQYPTARSIGGHRFGTFMDDGRVTTTDFYRWVVPVLFAAAFSIKEIYWEDRFHPENHGTGYFAQRFTSFIDCAPIYVERPDDAVMEHALFDGKSGKGHCYKIQVAINFLGWIVMYTGLHISKVQDNTVFEKTWPQHPLEDFEWWFGDSIYKTCDHVLAKYTIDDGGVLSDWQQYINNQVNFWRQRVEHIMGVIKKHGAFRQNFRGCHFLLHAIVKLTVNMTNCSLRKSWISEEGKARYAGFNYGAHNRF